MYFYLLVLFFEQNVNVTVWTVANAIPYPALLLYNKYKMVYGIISLQAKESKHSGIKYDLTLTNRSRSTGELGKWWQIMRANYVRAFYLPEHQPMPSSYISHFQSRLPPFLDNPKYCECGRERNEGGTCTVCKECTDILVCAKYKKLTDSLLQIVKPVTCDICKERFPDTATLRSHCQYSHSGNQDGGQKRQTSSRDINPKDMSVKQLKEELGLLHFWHANANEVHRN